MEESILTSIKKLLGITEECTDFDTDIIMHINTVLAVLCQVGAGPEKGFFISDSTAKWKDFLGSDVRLNLVKSYVHLRVRLMFDPPSSSSVLDSIKRTVDELEWRITVIDGESQDSTGSANGNGGDTGQHNNNDPGDSSGTSNGSVCSCGGDKKLKSESKKMMILTVKDKEYYDS